MGDPVDYRGHVDPEYRRWGRKYPRFPGVAECLRLVRAGKARGAWADIVAYELAAHASEYLDELVAAFRTGEDETMRQTALTAVADARLPTTVPFLVEVIREQHPHYVPIAERGLAAIETKEA